MMTLVEIIQGGQPFLLKRILYYAKLHNYVKFTSTLEEAWIASLVGLSDALISCIQEYKIVPEMNVDQDFMTESIVQFGIIEAKRHRQRGITLEMFLGLLKYYRQSYIDLIIASTENHKQQLEYMLWVNRFFDQNEIAFCKEWNIQSKETLLSELQKTNRELLNEKNKFLTIFKSIPTPVLFFDTAHYCRNLNYAAQSFLQEHLQTTGHSPYSTARNQKAESVIPCIYTEYQTFCQGNSREATVEKDCMTSTQGMKKIIIKFHRMLDFSGKFAGTVIILTDQTEQKLIEEQLRYMSFFDTLTGLYNRSFYDLEIQRLTAEGINSIGIVSCDIDGLKLINDNLGHHAGDLLIKLVSDILKSHFRKTDILCRIGGDEFLAFMPNCDNETISDVCQRTRQAIEQHNATNSNKPMSFSIGWTISFSCECKDILKAIKAADGLMYSEKKSNHEKYSNLFLSRYMEFGKELFC